MMLLEQSSEKQLLEFEHKYENLLKQESECNKKARMISEKLREMNHRVNQLKMYSESLQKDIPQLQKRLKEIATLEGNEKKWKNHIQDVHAATKALEQRRKRLQIRATDMLADYFHQMARWKAQQQALQENEEMKQSEKSSMVNILLIYSNMFEDRANMMKNRRLNLEQKMHKLDRQIGERMQSETMTTTKVTVTPETKLEVTEPATEEEPEEEPEEETQTEEPAEPKPEMLKQKLVKRQSELSGLIEENQSMLLTLTELESAYEMCRQECQGSDCEITLRMCETIHRNLRQQLESPLS